MPSPLLSLSPSLLHASYSSFLNEAPSSVSYPTLHTSLTQLPHPTTIHNQHTHNTHFFCLLRSLPPSLPSSPSVLACLFVTKDNPAGLRLYEKAGYLPVQCDLKRKRFRPLLEAGAIHEDDLEGVVFMCKYIKPLVGKAGGGGREGMRQGQGEQGGWKSLFY